jgi:hypothetical protein
MKQKAAAMAAVVALAAPADFDQEAAAAAMVAGAVAAAEEAEAAAVAENKEALGAALRAETAVLVARDEAAQAASAKGESPNLDRAPVSQFGASSLEAQLLGQNGPNELLLELGADTLSEQRRAREEAQAAAAKAALKAAAKKVELEEAKAELARLKSKPSILAMQRAQLQKAERQAATETILSPDIDEEVFAGDISEVEDEPEPDDSVGNSAE